MPTYFLFAMHTECLYYRQTINKPHLTMQKIYSLTLLLYNLSLHVFCHTDTCQNEILKHLHTNTEIITTVFDPRKIEKPSIVNPAIT